MTTTLNCLGWMQNQNDQTPCTTAQEVGELCSSGYTVSQTNFNESNYVPNTTTANGCTCSWSIYNLLSACSYCVGQYQYTSWSAWVTDCGSFTSNTSYLPSGLSVSQGIPYWAATNPSTWENGTFNVTQAADIAAAAQPDVTGGPLPTSTTTASSSSSSVSVGAIVGGVIAGILIIIIGGLIIFWVVRRRRRQKPHMTPIGGPSFTPSGQNQITVRSSPFGYTNVSQGPLPPRITTSIHSTASLAATSPLISPISSGFSHGNGAVQPLADAADMISPFLTMAPGNQTNRTSRGKAAEARAGRVMAPPEQRTRLNPPPYSPSLDPASPGAATTTLLRKTSAKKQKKRRGSMLVTTYSEHSRTSTRESATAVDASSGMEQSQPRVTTRETGRSMEGVVSSRSVAGDKGGSTVGVTQDGRTSVSESAQHPPVV